MIKQFVYINLLLDYLTIEYYSMIKCILCAEG